MRRRNSGNQIICPECGHPDARRYDYDNNGTPGSYVGYCPNCRLINGSSGQMRMRWNNGGWLVTWKAPKTTKQVGDKRCNACDAVLHDTNKTGYCRNCRHKYRAVAVYFAVCRYRNCQRWFSHRRKQYRAYCSRECDRAEGNRRAREMAKAGVKPKRNTVKANRRYEVAYRHGYKCARCRKLLNLGAKHNASNAMQIDHIVEVALGGTNDLTNLRPLCVPCHQTRRLGDQVQLRIA